VQFLAALLRLGDELSMTYERAPKILRHILADIKEEDKWDVRQSIADVVIDPAKWMIEIRAVSESYHITDQLRRLERYVQSRLEEIRPYLSKNEC
jgi:hypothetical protein